MSSEIGCCLQFIGCFLEFISISVGRPEDMADVLSRKLWFVFSYIRRKREKRGSLSVRACWKQNQVDICYS